MSSHWTYICIRAGTDWRLSQLRCMRWIRTERWSSARQFLSMGGQSMGWENGENQPQEWGEWRSWTQKRVMKRCGRWKGGLLQSLGERKYKLFIYSFCLKREMEDEGSHSDSAMFSCNFCLFHLLAQPKPSTQSLNCQESVGIYCIR